MAESTSNGRSPEPSETTRGGDLRPAAGPAGGDSAPPVPPSTRPAEAAPGTTAAAAPTGPEAQIRELQSLVVHLKADFDNYRKRMQKELQASIRTGELDAVRKFLPVFANLERARAASTGSPDAASLSAGIEQIVEQIRSVLQAIQVERIPTVGTPFDPTFHEAVAASPSAGVPAGTVLDEFEPGFQADGRAVIPAKVRVSTTD